MTGYIIRRLLIGFMTLILITFVIYGLIRAMPGSPLTSDLAAIDPSKTLSQEDYQRMAANYGLDKPWHLAYWTWLKNLCVADLGQSFRYKKPVVSVIAERVWPTLLLSVTSLILMYVISIPLGLWATQRSGKLDERILSTFLYMLYSLPRYVAALLLLSLFAVRLDGTMFELPLRGMYSDAYDQMTFFQKVGDVVHHMLLPTFCLTYASLAYYSRFIKSNTEEVIRQDFIRTARAKGAGPMRVLFHHAFRNTLIPFVTMLGLTLPFLLSGSVILEQIFTWPGMGRLYFESLLSRDYPTMMGLTLMFAVLTLLGQLLADIMYAVVDPRVSYT